MELSLIGKNALVGGGSKGIGRAVAVELAALGARVTLLARNEMVLRAVVNALPQIHPTQQHDFLVVDYAHPAELAEAVTQLVSADRVYHILFNNTGGPAGGAIVTAPVSAFEAAFAQHLLCNQLLVQQLLPGMRTAGYGRIINMLSTSVKAPLDNLGVSNTIRAAVANWAKTLANEVAPWGITVNNVLPGFTATERLEEVLGDAAAKKGVSLEQEMTTAQKSIPMGRFGTPAEIAAGVAFLATPAAAYITGINLPIDGGRTRSL